MRILLKIKLLVLEKIRIKHSNRKLHNWLVYKNMDRILWENNNLYRGVIYDLGCGEKPYEPLFLQQAEKYIGVDWSNTPHLLKADIVADLNKPLSIESEVADVVVSISVLEHLCEPMTMLSESFRILKPGGSILLQVPWQWWIHEAPYDFYRYSPYGLNYLFEKAGFKEISVKPTAGYFSMMALKSNYFLLRMLKIPKFPRAILKGLFIPIWFITQVTAPLLDKLDRNWLLETQGYWVLAKKM